MQQMTSWLWVCLATLSAVFVVGVAQVNDPLPKLRQPGFLQTHGEKRGKQAAHMTRSQEDAGGMHFDYIDHGASWGCPVDQQSPINISEAAISQSQGEVILYRYGVYERPLKMRNDGLTLVAEFEGNVGGLSVGTDSYDLWKIVARTPSEHTFGGKRVPLELQLFHKRSGASTQGVDIPPADIAVVSLGFVRAAFGAAACEDCSCGKCTFLDSLTQGGLPRSAGDATMVNRAAPAALDIAALLAGASLWEYTGSLTTPPCGIGTRWFIRSEIIEATRPNIAKFIDTIHGISPSQQHGEIGNARALQNIGSRTILLHKTLGQQLTSPTVAPSDPEFDAAESDAMGQQQSFETDMKNTKKQAKTPQETEHQRCIKELGIAETNLAARKHHRDAECNALTTAQRDVTESGAGLTRLAAIKRTTAQSFLCTAESKTVKRLELEVEHLQGMCGSFGISSFLRR